MYNAAFLEQSLPKMAVYVLDSIDSTSAFLKRRSAEILKPSLCVTHHQTAGYGQRGSAWVSDLNSVTFSLVLPIDTALNNLMGLSQLIALTLQQRLSLYTTEQIKLKWPNDLFINDAKVGGLLIEVIKHSINQTWLVIGVGLNTGFIDSFDSGNYRVAGINIGDSDRNRLLVDLVKDIGNLFLNFNSQLWSQQLGLWKRADVFETDEEVCLLKNSNKQYLHYVGVSHFGELMLSNISVYSQSFNQDYILYFNSGTVSIRRLEWLM